MVSESDPPTVIASPRNKDSLPTVASQIPQDAGLAPVPYTGRNCLRKFLPPGGPKPANLVCLIMFKM